MKKTVRLVLCDNLHEDIRTQIVDLVTRGWMKQYSHLIETIDVRTAQMPLSYAHVSIDGAAEHMMSLQAEKAALEVLGEGNAFSVQFGLEAAK